MDTKDILEDIARTSSDAAEVAMLPGVEIWKRLNRRNPETGAPEGTVAIMRERMLHTITQAIRAPKIGSFRYGRRLQFV
jgi:hypothetical protein